ncbi:GGDEF domain-containing protein [Mycolicibacterium palauense]|uniref:GGDEF domain-containing protein n=1 Tax=Mycolicibacterium palauense TaxID=2034511 RepID=UPI000BFF19A8|nr:GGDEF domain-containing protein [Mycolicibacterium palauense]
MADDRGPDFGAGLRQRMLVTYLVILLGLYLLAVVTARWVDTPPSRARGEEVAVALCLVGLGLAIPVRGRVPTWRYGLSVVSAGAAPIVPLLFHDRIEGQVWSVVPLMFMAVHLRTWHRPAVARAAAAVIALVAAAALVTGPAPVPRLWLVLYVVSILGAAEVFGVLNSALLDAALRDPLTRVWNRAGIEHRAERTASRARRKGEPLAVLAFDVDDFKGVNDRDGHAAGDRVLTGLTRRWVARLPESAMIGRVGGDEFVVAVPGYDEARARRLAEDLVDGHTVRVTYGVAVGSAEGEGFPALLEAADADLYRAKRERKSG